MNLDVDQTFAARYRVLRPLGSGTMGRVFEVEDLYQGKQRVALKLLARTDPNWEERFQREFLLLSTSRHPNIVQVFDYGVEGQDRIPYYTAELLTGRSLEVEERLWPVQDILELASQICRALSFLHTRGIIHSDIKPSNLIEIDQEQRYVLVDFGVAQLRQDISSDHVAGTPAYMAPELVTGHRYDDRADLFSLGITLYKLACGVNPIARLPLGLSEHARPKIEPIRRFRPDFPTYLDEIICKAIAWNPDGRYQKASQMLQALHRSSNRAVPLETPESLRAYASSPQLIGRDEVLREILAPLGKLFPASATAVKPAFAILGPLGIGKSRILDEVRRSFQLQGVSTTFVSCGSEASSVADILQRLARRLSMLSTSKSGNTPDQNIQLMLGELKPRKPDIPLQENIDVLEALSSWIGSVTRDAPHALLIDDLDLLSVHEKIQLLWLIRKLTAPSSAQLCLVWSSEVEEIWMNDVPSLHRIKLRPLSDEEVGSYLAFFEPEIHPEVRRAVAKKSDGIPLILEEVVRHLLPHVEALRHVESVQLVDGIAISREALDLFEHRLRDLPANSLLMAQMLSVSSVPLPLAALEARIWAKRGPVFKEAVRNLTEMRLIRPEVEAEVGALTIANQGLASAVIRRLSPTEQSFIQGQVADVLLYAKEFLGCASLYWEQAIARHLLQSPSPMSAFPHLVASITSLTRMHGYREARRLLDLASAVLDAPGNTQELTSFRSLGAEVYSRVGEFDRSLHLLDSLPGHTSDAEVARLRRRADVLVKKRNLDAALATIGRAETLLSDLSEPVRSEEHIRLLSLRQVIALYRADWKIVEKLGGEIEESAPHLLWKERALALNLRGHAARETGDLPGARDFYQQVLSESEKNNDPSSSSMAWGSLALYYEAGNDHANAVKAFQSALSAAERSSDVQATATHLLNLGRLHQKRGDYMKALRSFERSVEIYQRLGNRGGYAHALYRQAALLNFLVKSPAVETMGLEALQLAIESGNGNLTAYSRLLLADACKKSEDAIAHLTDAERDFQGLHDSNGLAEARLVGLARRLSANSDHPPIEELDLEQRIRLMEILYSIYKEEAISSTLVSNQFMAECRQHPNTEWLARLLTLQAKIFCDRQFSLKGAQKAREALVLLEQKSADLDETYQVAYLSIRHYEELERIATAIKDQGLTEAPNSLVDVTTASKSLPPGIITTAARLKQFVESSKTASDLSDLFQKGLEVVGTLLHATRAAIVLQEGAKPVIASGWKTRKEDENEWVLHYQEGAGTGAFDNKQQVWVPLSIGNSLKGALYVGRNEGASPFTDEDMGWLRLIAVILQNQIEHQQILHTHRSQAEQIASLQMQIELQRSVELRSEASNGGNGKVRLSSILDRITESLIRQEMKRHGGKKSRVAHTLGLSRGGLLKMIRRLKIE